MKVHKNALFHTKYLKKFSRSHTRWGEVHPLTRPYPLGTYGTSTPRLRCGLDAFGLSLPPTVKILATSLYHQHAYCDRQYYKSSSNCHHHYKRQQQQQQWCGNDTTERRAVTDSSQPLHARSSSITVMSLVFINNAEFFSLLKADIGLKVSLAHIYISTIW